MKKYIKTLFILVIASLFLFPSIQSWFNRTDASHHSSVFAASPNKDHSFEKIYKRFFNMFDKNFTHNQNSNNFFEDDLFSNTFENDMFEDMKRIRQRMNKILKNDNFFSDPFSSPFGKNINIEETEDMITVHALLPQGFNASNIKVSLKNQNILSITADIERKTQNNSMNAHEKRTYRQIVTLPMLADEQSLKIKQNDDKITIEIKKLEPGYNNKQKNLGNRPFYSPPKQNKKDHQNIFDDPDNFI